MFRKTLIGRRWPLPALVLSSFALLLIIAFVGYTWWSRPKVTYISGLSPFTEISTDVVLDHGAGQECSACHGDAFREEGDRLVRPVQEPEGGEEVQVETGEGEGEEGEGGGGPVRRMNWFWRQRAYPLDTVPVDANLKAVRRAERMTASQAPEQAWTSVGPAPLQQGLIGISSCSQTDCEVWRTNVSGRVKAIAFHPTNPNIVYVGTATGGVWKSTDGGNTYVPLTDNLPSFSIFSLAIDRNNPNVIYAGTGEISGYYGIGLLKSTNGGQSWTILGQNEFAGMVVTSILIHPNNSNLLYVSTAHPLFYVGKASALPGVFRSTNGGQSWEALLRCNQMCYGFSDLVMEDVNPQVLYAAFASGGIYKSTNGGNSWAPVPNFPDRGYVRIELGIGSGGGSGTIYAGLAARVNVSGQIQPWGVILKSTDHGQSWQVLQSAPNYCSSQCNYDNIITVDPRNPNVVYIGGSFVAQGNRWAGVVHKSTDGGQTWQDMTPGTALNRMVHPDMHAIALVPTNPDIVWVGNDGGLFRSTNGGQTWEQRNGNLATLQFVNIGVHPTNPNIVFGGLQDNAKAKYDGTRWTGLDTGDGGYSEIDPFNPNIWYSTRFSIKGLVVQFQRNDNGGTASLADWVQRSQGIDINDRMEFYVPFALDRSSSGVLYLGTHRLYRTANRGDSWTAISGDLTKGQQTNGTITAIGVAPGDPQTIYVGTSDGNVQVTRNRGGSWTNVTKSPLPNRQVGDFAISPTSASVAYVVFNGYDTHTPGSPGHVFKTTNAGQSWQNISSNLPDIPVLTIVIDPQNPTHLYVGTDIGVFRSTNDGGSWAYYNTGLAQVPVYDLELQQATRLLWAGTYGRGVFRLSLGGSPPPSGQQKEAFLPLLVRLHPRAQATPTRTPTLPPSGPAPGYWEGDDATFNVTSDQANVWDVRIKVPVPGCETWVSYPYLSRIGSGTAFSFTVDLRENGLWRNNGRFTSRTTATGTAQFTNMYFGMSCGNWTGTVDWTATWRSGAANPTATPTPGPGAPTPTPASTAGIHGQVRYQGAGLSGINVILRRCPTSGPCNVEASKVMTVTTGANGYYNFVGAPTLPAAQFYLVWYFNDERGGNIANDKYLWRWYAPRITSYTAGASVSGGSFDIADIRLLAPTEATVSLPTTFSWSTRGISGEHYAWELFDLNTGDTVCDSGDTPLPSPEFTLTESYFLNTCHGQYGTKYGWFAWVVAGPSWSNGYGDSFYYAEITFRSTGAPTPTPTRTVGPTSTPTPTPTTAPAGGISGVVRFRGSGVSGVNLQLRRCTGGSCSVVANVVTGSGGAYNFTGVPTLPAGYTYHVFFWNHANGGNTPNPNRLAWWRSFDITSYTAGSSVNGGNFDIGDVALNSPPHNSSQTLPTTFTWTKRGVSGDRYSWAIASSDLSTQWCFVDPPADAGSFTLDEYTGGIVCSLFYNVPYAWYVYVANGTWSNGYGVSYYYRLVTFIPSLLLKENRFLREGDEKPRPPLMREPFPTEGDLPKPHPPPEP
jgi:photosystem II stability/assembly factor-like uncharacterized protein